jgi:hypothetical protein
MNSQAPYPQVIEKRRGFWATLAWGFSVTIILIVLCGATIILYWMNIADRRTCAVLGSLESAARSLSIVKESLPPVLADAVNDQRRPEYTRMIEVTAKLPPNPDRKGGVRPSVEVYNRGDDMVSLLSLRVVLLNKDGEPIAEHNEWAATPIAADQKWRGPLLPHSRRHFLGGPIHLDGKDPADDLRVETEITDIRIWSGEKPATRPANRFSPRTQPGAR